MAEADLAKIVNLIMENPHLIEEIKKLSKGSEDAPGSTEEKAETAEVTAEGEVKEDSTATSTYKHAADTRHLRRRDLISALKPYVSTERGAAIDSMMSIAEILDAMSSR